jgi:hypothetical protein
MPTATAGRVSTRARCFATAPSLEEVSAAPATSVPSPEEVAELWEEHKPAKKFTRFNKDDPLNLESLLTEEEVMVKDSVHDFCQDNLVPRVQDGFRNEEFDRTMVRHAFFAFPFFALLPTASLHSPYHQR